MFGGRALTRKEIRLAYAVAVTTDVLQLVAGPLGWMFGDEILDVLAALIESRLIGFHPLLLPTFAIEFLPVTDMLPTWTGCVALVIAMRKKQYGIVDESVPPAGHVAGDVIEAKATRVE